MWIYRRFFTCIVACGLLLGSLFFIRLQLNYNGDKKPAPDFLPNVARFRTSRVCSTRTLVLVNSAPSGSHRRQVIRETWAHPSVTQALDVSVAFGVGAADTIDVQRSLDWEAEIYGDIFQDSAVDSGAKSASKVMELLKMARSACLPLPEFVMKVEDDVFLNTLALGELLENLETYSTSNTMWCLEWNRKLDNLGNNSTWAVMKRHASVYEHPTYCIGTAYLMTGRALDAVIRRHDVQTGRTRLPEDVYLGTLAKEARIVLSLFGERFAFDAGSEEVDAERMAIAFLGDRMQEETTKLWAVIVKGRFNNSRRSDIGL